jgi:DNA repair protein RadC
MTQRIRDLPSDERPREKLARLGPGALDNAELLALLIGSGTRGCSAIQIGHNLIALHGGLAALGRLDLAELRKTRGLGKAKACELAAIFEIAIRVAREEMQVRPMDEPRLVYAALGPQLGHLPYETLQVILLNTKLSSVGVVEVSRGTINETLVHPREVLKPVIARAAYGFVLVHNHPSGDPTPSRADEAFTRRLRDAAELLQLRFLDHVIIGCRGAGREPWFSFKEAGML